MLGAVGGCLPGGGADKVLGCKTIAILERGRPFDCSQGRQPAGRRRILCQFRGARLKSQASAHTTGANRGHQFWEFFASPCRYEFWASRLMALSSVPSSSFWALS